MMQTVINQLREASAADFAKHPNFIFMGLLRTELMDTARIHSEDAEDIVASMNIQIQPGVATNGELHEVAIEYACIIDNIRRALMDQGFNKPVKVIKKMSMSVVIGKENEDS